ncbi:MAG TPA: hypothetical protein VGO89_22850 [Streptomyces sp.]|jgi:hypothetical protein|nr:hypothetical protein [Streptomyces sp.]
MAELPAPATALQPPDDVRAYTAELRRLTGRLDPAAGWYAVFATHDPDGLRDCMAGREIPPWDVVASLLHDVTQQYGQVVADQAENRLRPLHEAAVAAYDAHDGDGVVLRERLAAAERERDESVLRVRELEAALAGSVPDAELGTDLAWARDYFTRIEARCAELGARLTALAVPAVGPSSPELPAPGPPEPAPPRKKRGRSGGSRFAGGVDDAGAESTEPAPIVPPGEPAGGDGSRVPRGARFAGAVQEGAGRPSGPGEQELAEARVPAAEAVMQLTRLRRENRGGEAHGLLCAAAGWPAIQLAVLVRELQQSGLGADAGTLLWEAATLPAAEFAAAAEALSALGRHEDSARLLRQGVSRPLPQIADAALRLYRAGRTAEATELLAALVRSRSAAEVVELTHAEPGILVAALLEAADAVSPNHYRSVANAMRVTGLPGVPEAR